MNTRLKKNGRTGTVAQKKAIQLQELAQRIELEDRPEGSALPQDLLSELKDFCNHAKETQQKLRKWGFDQSRSHNNGLNILFSNPSAEGKLPAAEFIASELKMPLYAINLSTLAGKAKGDTENGLNQIFDSAETSNAVLFFSEAEVVFGKRSQSSDAQNDQMNTQTDHLLQRLEQFSGIVILATNQDKSLISDIASRVHYAVEFPVSEDASKKRPLERVLSGFRRVLGKE